MGDKSREMMRKHEIIIIIYYQLNAKTHDLSLPALTIHLHLPLPLTEDVSYGWPEPFEVFL